MTRAGSEDPFGQVRPGGTATPVSSIPGDGRPGPPAAATVFRHDAQVTCLVDPGCTG
ncbi:hypothetical protein KBX50_10715 [Micromonospora sp. C51]|uniref:hypothetical protein n=1 Tax=Micromonospora sp. C51 TaxID=2824879 RepID=UPI001B3886DA|nr:hypothetical protein [Micromonospora sp. C51]MBQ1048926.1 hypothetical protein [Micromonospora sp. C51]